MASLTSTINLVDRMSPILFGITSAVDNVITAMDRANRSMGNAFDPNLIYKARTALGEANARVREMEDGLRRSGQQQTNFNRKIREGQQGISSLTRRITSMVSAYAALNGVKQIGNSSDTYIQTQARLNMLVDSQQELSQLQDQIFASAQRSRAAYGTTADVVSKLALRAGDVWDNNQQTIIFAENLNKMFAIAGASQAEMSSASLQLVQALGSGVLRGEELNAVFESAPNVIQSIADYMGKPIGKIRELAKDGQITSKIVKDAILGSTDEINQQFDNMPMTWSQAWTEMKNIGTYAMQGLYEKMNGYLNSDEGQRMIDNITSGIIFMTGVLSGAFDVITDGINFVGENLDIIMPFAIGAVTVLAARMVWAAGVSLVAWTIANWPLVLVCVSIAAIIIALEMLGFTGTEIFSGLTGGINVVIAALWNSVLTIGNVAAGVTNAAFFLGDNLKIAFHNSICSIKEDFWDLLASATEVISNIANKLNMLPFVDIDTTGLDNAASEYAAKADAAWANKMKYTDIGEAFEDGMNTFDAFEDGWADDAFQKGQQWGRDFVGNVGDKLNEVSEIMNKYSLDNLKDLAGIDNISDKLNSIDKNTKKTAKAVSLSATDIRYMLDIAARRSVDRYTTANINVSLTNNNTINKDLDIDGVVNKVNKKMLKEINERWSASLG